MIKQIEKDWTAHLPELTRNGFLVIDDFLDAETVRNLLIDVQSLETDTDASLIRRGVPFARRNLLQHDFVRNLLGKTNVRELLNGISPGLIAVRAILFDKSGSANWTVPWHQDRSIAVRQRIDIPGFGPWSIKADVHHVQPPLEILQQMVTLRFHLNPCGPDNGPLRVIAGTHETILNQDEVDAAMKRQQNVCTTGEGGVIVMRPTDSPCFLASHQAFS